MPTFAQSPTTFTLHIFIVLQATHLLLVVLSRALVLSTHSLSRHSFSLLLPSHHSLRVLCGRLEDQLCNFPPSSANARPWSLIVSFQQTYLTNTRKCRQCHAPPKALRSRKICPRDHRTWKGDIGRQQWYAPCPYLLNVDPIVSKMIAEVKVLAQSISMDTAAGTPLSVLSDTREATKDADSQVPMHMLLLSCKAEQKGHKLHIYKFSVQLDGKIPDKWLGRRHAGQLQLHETEGVLKMRKSLKVHRLSPCCIC